jgi:hypothetical protein
VGALGLNVRIIIQLNYYFIGESREGDNNSKGIKERKKRG